MKTGINFIIGLGVAWALSTGAADTVKPSSTTAQRIMESTEDAKGSQLSDKEELAHVQRLARLRELKQEQQQIHESAGSEKPASDVSPAKNESTERLIEAIEALQMEIRTLNKTLTKSEAKERFATPQPDFLPDSGHNELPQSETR